MSTIKHSQISALLVDDDAKLCGLLRDYLEGFGFSLDVAEDASSGLEKAVANEYDVILLDMMLPDMDGLEATRHIRGMTREDARRIPIFALSANAFADDIQRSLQCGMNTHFNKPVDMDSICAALHYWLEHDKGNRP